MSTVQTQTVWEAKYAEAADLAQRVVELRREAEATHCPFRIAQGDQCMYDRGHDDDHRLNQWAWMEFPRREP